MDFPRMERLNVWMQLPGFEMTDPDRGVERFLRRAEFLPRSICILLQHPDFVNLHPGMEREVPLFPDNCAYYAAPRNRERHRQNWTNFALRELVAALHSRGIEVFAGLMGSCFRNEFHHEWASDHPEILGTPAEAEPKWKPNLLLLKHMADGRLYEDFFMDRLLEVLEDYGFDGAHLADGLCPNSTIWMYDYSRDMFGQFAEATGTELPEELCGEDTLARRQARAAWILETCPARWTRFWVDRWTASFRKICSRAHAAGKQIWTLGMYCTDPFETRVIYGFDCGAAAAAGVDCITANVLPTGVMMNSNGRPEDFYRQHMDTPFLRAQVGGGKIRTMLGIQDATEEWDLLAHVPARLERDLYTTLSFRAAEGGRLLPATEGLFFCLGDGISRADWDFLLRRFTAVDSAEVVRELSPLAVRSAAGDDALLEDWFKSFRPSAHKQAWELFRRGCPFGGAADAGETDRAQGVLFAPNFDLMTAEEQAKLAGRADPWVGTAPVGFDPAAAGVRVSRVFRESDAEGLQVFLVNAELSPDALAALAAAGEGVSRAPESTDLLHVDSLRSEIPFRRSSEAFYTACRLFLSACTDTILPLKADCPVHAQRLADGRLRLWLYNPRDEYYGRATVRTNFPILSAETASAYPVLPVRYLDESGMTLGYADEAAPGTASIFTVKLAPAGVCVVDLRLQEP